MATTLRVLHDEPAFSDFFLRSVLSQNIRIEEDLVDQLFNSSETRLAHLLLLLATQNSQDVSVLSQNLLPDLHSVSS